MHRFQELIGSRKFSNISLQACHALRGPRQTFRNLTQKNGSFVLASSSLTPSPSAPQRTTPLLRYYRGYLKSSAYAVYLWPTWFSVYASAISFGSFVLLHNCNTRYGLVVSLCPIGSFTLQEMGSFTCRTNGLRYWRWGGRGLCLRAEKNSK
jgi:hypothetical protein